MRTIRSPLGWCLVYSAFVLSLAGMFPTKAWAGCPTCTASCSNGCDWEFCPLYDATSAACGTGNPWCRKGTCTVWGLSTVFGGGQRCDYICGYGDQGNCLGDEFRI